MCSRYSLTSPPEAVRAYFRYLNEAVFPPRYNIAPSQPVAIVRNTLQGRARTGAGALGLDPAVGQGSARILDPDQCPLRDGSRQALVPRRFAPSPLPRARRRLLRVDRQRPAPSARISFAARRRPDGDGRAIYEHWLGADGSEIETMAILTVAANSACRCCTTACPRSSRPSSSTSGSIAAGHGRTEIARIPGAGARGSARHRRGLAANSTIPATTGRTCCSRLARRGFFRSARSIEVTRLNEFHTFMP